MKNKITYPCPSCGFLVFSEPPGSYEICSIRGWEDDHVQLSNPGLRGGANGGSLKDYQEDILNEYPQDVKEVDGLKREADWRPLTDDESKFKDPNLDKPEPKRLITEINSKINFLPKMCRKLELRY